MARTTALTGLLDRIERLNGTPIARHARDLRARLPDCPVVASAEDVEGGLSELLAGLQCASGTGVSAALDDPAHPRDGYFAIPLDTGGHLEGTLRAAADGDVELELHLPRSAFEGARALLAPGADPPGPVRLRGADAVIHARIKPAGGLGLARFVPEDGQGAQLFALRSGLFEGAVLDGTWELGVYLPESGARMPRAAIAVGFERRAPAVAAMERFVSEVRARWPVKRSYFEIGDAPGACLLDLALLPELAPCYVATRDALVVGWNPASLRTALRRGARGTLGAEGGLVVDFGRVAEADALLSRGDAGAAPLGPVRYPWDALRVRGSGGANGVRFRIELSAGGDA